jgi:ATP synthase F1 gamma subunit
MKNRRQLIQEMASLKNMQEIIGAYEEIAAMRMRKVKKSVLQNRDFLSGLNNIYQRVWYTYEITKHIKGSKKFTSLISTNKKTVSILLSANTGLYGDIIKKTFNLFLKNIQNSATDILVVGKIGKQQLEAALPGVDYKYYEISDTSVNRDALNPVLDMILKYTNIVVYHGIYVSVLNQNAVRTYVTGQAVNIKESTASNELKCLIEPNVENVAAFFEKQILASIFEQSVFESSLSKFASRMTSLDMATENIQGYIKKQQFQMLKFKHMQNNTRQQERLSGLVLWK